MDIKDATRTNWPWARTGSSTPSNQNMPFDQFTIEQFAGDLLPKAFARADPGDRLPPQPHDQRGRGPRPGGVARIDYVIDRINTTGTVWMELTVGRASATATSST